MTVWVKLLANKTCSSDEGLSPRITIIPRSRYLAMASNIFFRTLSLLSSSLLFFRLDWFPSLSALGTHRFNSVNFLIAPNHRWSDILALDRLAVSRRAFALIRQCLRASRPPPAIAAPAEMRRRWLRVCGFNVKSEIRDSDPESSSEWSEKYSVSDFIRLVHECSHSSLTVMLLLSQCYAFFSLFENTLFAILALIDLCYL